MAVPFHSIRRGKPFSCTIQHFADGDTVIIAVQCCCKETWHRVTVRIAGIDSWEVKSRDVLKALWVKVELEKKFKYKRGELFCKMVNSDKYGRVVGDIKIEGIMLSEYIINNKLGWIH